MSWVVSWGMSRPAYKAKWRRSNHESAARSRESCFSPRCALRASRWQVVCPPWRGVRRSIGFATMTARRRFVAYYRVSTQQQGRSGLGLAAQQEAVGRHVSSVAGDLVDAFEEVETGKLNSRPALAQALAACRAMHATLIIAKLDRLARNAAFLLSVVAGSGQ